MSSDILSVLEYMEREKGIQRANMIEAIISSIKAAAEKAPDVAGQDLHVEINPRNGALKAFIQYTVVDSVSDSASEIHIEKAHHYADDPKIGDVVQKEIDPSFLGRIAAQTVRQLIMQRVRQFEKDRIFDEYKSQIGDIVTGTVRRRERGDLVVDLGKAEAMLLNKERIPGEDYAPGERIRCLLLEIENTNRGPEIILSRSHPNFVRRLLELEVAEVSDGTVFIAAMAREPGYRTKIAVDTKDSKVDPVGACVGSRGVRVKSIVRELAGERVDIMRFHTDPKQMLIEAMKPAVPKNIRIDTKERRIFFEVSDEDISLALGRRNQNARITSKLMGWRLDIDRERSGAVGFEARKQKAVEGISHIPGLTDDVAQKLVAMGIISAEAFEGVTQADLLEFGFTNDQANDIFSKMVQPTSSKPKQKEDTQPIADLNEPSQELNEDSSDEHAKENS
jgi:transcription termination/antitermination protein NusA